MFLYGFAALVVAFLAGMGAAQLSFRWRPSLNVAFVTGMLAFAATLAIWTAAFGVPRPSNLHATQTADAIEDESRNPD